MNVVAFAPVRPSRVSSHPLQIDDARSRAAVGDGASRRVDEADKPGDRAVDAALARIVASATFRHSKRHRAFVAYLVETVLDRRGASLKEVVIGLEVFGRRLDGYDPERDSIVRVEARRLRGKLASYYANEGRQDPVEIRLPVGRYAPEFAVRRPVVPKRRSPLFAVLPMLAEAAHVATATGIADRVMHRLGEMTRLRIMAPMTAAALRRHPDGLHAFATIHGVDFVVDGSLVMHGTRARCIVHLSRTSDGMRVWSRHFDFVSTAAEGTIDWLAAQDRIAEELASAVLASLEGDAS